MTDKVIILEINGGTYEYPIDSGSIRGPDPHIIDELKIMKNEVGIPTPFDIYLLGGKFNYVQ